MKYYMLSNLMVKIFFFSQINKIFPFHFTFSLSVVQLMFFDTFHKGRRG